MSGLRRAPKKYRIEVDDRTKDMTLEVLMCRSNSHPWTPLPISSSRRDELMDRGVTELVDTCLRCDLNRYQTFELGTGDMLDSWIDYKRNPDYLIKEKGTGRLSRREAKKALLVRRMPEFAA